MDELLLQLQELFREVFDDDELILRPEMTAKDIEGWDSLRHVDLIIATEARFRVKFATAEIARLADRDRNIGSFLELIAQKLP